MNRMNQLRVFPVACSLAIAAIASVTSVATATAIRPDAGFNFFTLAANDDGSTGPVAGVPINIHGTTYSSAFVNNNGNMTFVASSSAFTPSASLFSSASAPILAPFFADVDTRGAGSGLVRYGASTVDGHTAAGVNWTNVGYYNSHVGPVNTFQLVIIQRLRCRRRRL